MRRHGRGNAQHAPLATPDSFFCRPFSVPIRSLFPVLRQLRANDLALCRTLRTNMTVLTRLLRSPGLCCLSVLPLCWRWFRALCTRCLRPNSRGRSQRCCSVVLVAFTLVARCTAVAGRRSSLPRLLRSSVSGLVPPDCAGRSGCLPSAFFCMLFGIGCTMRSNEDGLVRGGRLSARSSTSSSACTCW